MNERDTLVFPGSEVKALGDGRFGGYLVLFGSAEKTDLAGDYFTAATDFGLHASVKTRVYFDHGTDPTVGRRYVGEGELKADAKGVWLDAQLRAREDYSDAVKEIIGKDLPALIAGKKLGLSSGTAGHLVERKKVGDVFEITAWPLGLDASLTATPCEPRTLAVPLKSWVPSAAKGVHLGDRAEVGAAMQAVQHLHGRLHEQTWQHMGDEKSSPSSRLRKIGKAYDECKALAMGCIKSLMGEAAPDDAAKALDDRAFDEFLMMEDRLRGLEID